MLSIFKEHTLWQMMHQFVCLFFLSMTHFSTCMLLVYIATHWTKTWDVTWAARDLLTPQGVYGVAEELEGLSAALLCHPPHHLDQPLHVGGFQSQHLEDRSRGGFTHLLHFNIVWVGFFFLLSFSLRPQQQPLTRQLHAQGCFSRSQEFSLASRGTFSFLLLD